MEPRKEIRYDRIFSLLVEILHEKNFLEAKRRPSIHDYDEGHENGNSIGLFIVQNSKNVLDFIHEDIIFNDIEKLDLKKFLVDHAEPKKDGALIITDTKISNNVFFSEIVGTALRNVRMKKMEELLNVLLPSDFSHSDKNRIEVGNKTRTALCVPIACKEGKTYLLKKSAYKNLEEGTGKAAMFGEFGLEIEFFFAKDPFLPLYEDYYFDEKRTIGVIKTYAYNRLTHRVENTGKFVVNARKFLGGEGLSAMAYPTVEKMEFLLEKIRNG